MTGSGAIWPPEALQGKEGGLSRAMGTSAGCCPTWGRAGAAPDPCMALPWALGPTAAPGRTGEQRVSLGAQWSHLTALPGLMYEGGFTSSSHNILLVV